MCSCLEVKRHNGICFPLVETVVNGINLNFKVPNRAVSTTFANIDDKALVLDLEIFQRLVDL